MLLEEIGIIVLRTGNWMIEGGSGLRAVPGKLTCYLFTCKPA